MRLACSLHVAECVCDDLTWLSDRTSFRHVKKGWPMSALGGLRGFPLESSRTGIEGRGLGLVRFVWRARSRVGVREECSMRASKECSMKASKESSTQCCRESSMQSRNQRSTQCCRESSMQSRNESSTQSFRESSMRENTPRFEVERPHDAELLESIRRLVRPSIPRGGHVACRMQQRRIGEDAIAIALAYGSEVRRDRAATALLIDRRARCRIERELSLSPEELDRLEGIEVIVGRDGHVRTVYRPNGYRRRCRRLRRQARQSRLHRAR